MSVLLIFIDGLGIGTRGPHNPLHLLGDEAAPLAIFESEEPKLDHDGILVRTDAKLGVEGRPQSASGQTTILTGVNAPAQLGYHKQGFPNEAMREIIKEHSIFLQLVHAGIGPNTFANTYTRRFFDSRPRWVSATTVAVEAAGLRFNTVEDLNAGRAVFHDFTNQLALERGESVQIRTAEEAAAVLAEISSKHRFTLYEHFLTDRAGHDQDMSGALHVVRELALFVRLVIAQIDLSLTTLIVTSDHGNIEDLTSRNHTLNAVPTLSWGRHRETVRANVHSLADITPTIVRILTS